MRDVVVFNMIKAIVVEIIGLICALIEHVISSKLTGSKNLEPGTNR